MVRFAFSVLTQVHELCAPGHFIVVQDGLSSQKARWGQSAINQSVLIIVLTTELSWLNPRPGEGGVVWTSLLGFSDGT